MRLWKTFSEAVEQADKVPGMQGQNPKKEEPGIPAKMQGRKRGYDCQHLGLEHVEIISKK